MKICLTREQILECRDLVEPQEVPVPEWGGSVFLRPMNGTAKERWEVEHVRSGDKDVRARLLAHTVCDEGGQLLFKPEDIARLSGKSAAPLQRLFNAAMKMNAIGKEDVDELEKK